MVYHLSFFDTQLFAQASPCSVTYTEMSDDETYEIPLRDQRYFGSGLKRKRVQFVASTNDFQHAGIASSTGPSGQTASEKYLAIVLKRSVSEATTANGLENEHTAGFATDSPDCVLPTEGGEAVTHLIETCAICRLPIDASDKARPHEASLAHQVCLPHTHPPSALDRQRKGMSMMQSYGWNPDQRLGLGAAGEGILHPVKAREKRDRIGLGVETDADDRRRKGKKKPETKRHVERLDAGRVRQLDVESRNRDQKLREMFYRNDEVEKYLG